MNFHRASALFLRHFTGYKPFMRLLRLAFLLLLSLLLAAPLLGLATAWLRWDSSSAQVLSELAATVLGPYALNSAWLCLLVALGVTVLGVGCAVALSLFDFVGRKTLSWALLLPLAMPAYVLAYTYTDFLQYSGPLQTALRARFGWQGALLPEVRSLGGAAIALSFSLYPYVYVLVRTALAERASHLMQAAALLGAPLARRVWQVALPLARPALAAGLALALMETLADYGVSSYFGIQTFTTGIYKAWLAMDNHSAAAQLATLLLGVVALLLALERRAQRRLRFASAPSGAAKATPLRLRGWRAALVLVLCWLPVLLGFVLPLALMLAPLAGQWAAQPWGQLLGWAMNSLSLALSAAVLALILALVFAHALRTLHQPWLRAALRLASLGYALPGAVVVVGLLLPLSWLQARAPESTLTLLTATVLTASSAGLLWAYLVRFCAVALQPLEAAYARIPASVDESARLLGASGTRLALRIHAPLLKRSALAAALLVFIDVMKELPATLVLRPFNSDTLAVAVYQLARDERLSEAALPALALVLVCLLPMALLGKSLDGRGER